MDLKNQFAGFVKRQNIDAKTSSVREFVIKHKASISIGVVVAEACASFMTNRTPFALAKGAFAMMDTLGKESGRYAASYFSVKNGWEPVFSSHSMSYMLSRELGKLPQRVIGFDHVSDATIFTAPFGEFAYSYDDHRPYFFYRPKQVDKKTVIQFIIDENIKALNSNVIALYSKDSDNGIKKSHLTIEPIDPKPSKKLNEIVAHIRKAFSINTNRSIILYGPPGSGKTSIAQGIVSELKLRTLIYREDSFDSEIFFFIVKHFGIEAVIFDDFDTVSENKKLLKMLERLNKEVKLVIGLVNSLKGFHPAIIRPRRFDEIMHIDALDEDVVQGILGSLSAQYFEKVRGWPIAYINEFVSRSQLYPTSELEKHFVELNERVEEQLKDISEMKKEKASDEEDH